MSELELEQRKTSVLIPYARNARTHSDDQVRQLAGSIREFGFTNPILVDPKGVIVAGHGRVMAAELIGMESVPCIQIGEGWSEAKVRAYVVADNKLAENAGWDEELLALELEDLKGADVDLSLTGFDDLELEDLLGGGESEPEMKGNSDEVPEPPSEPVTKPGDIWVLGRHRVMCGDSTDAASVALLMDGKKAALLHADPPYGMGKEKDGVQNDNLYRDKLTAFQMDWWNAFRPYLEDNASAYIWGNAEELWRLWYAGGLRDSERLTFRNEVVWDKGNGQGMESEQHRMFPTASERALFFMLGERGFNNNADNYWEGWEPIRSYLDTERERAGWTKPQVEKILGSVNKTQHIFSNSYFNLITETDYKKLQSFAQGKAFKREYDELKRGHDELKRGHDELKQAFYATRAYFDNTHDNMTDVWDFQRVTGEERHGHATPKPAAMMERVMRSSLPEGGLCAEPFGGSGSTLIGADATGRTCYAMELSPTYVDVAVTRWQTLTGKTATHAESGLPFGEVTPS